MKASCPSCGADIEFRYDDSFVRVCSHCKAAIARSDRGLDSLGKVADLVPMESPLRLFADGQLGSQSFILVGMAQLRHAAGGLTQEWYARFSDTWGWLAEAQGRYYMTFEVEGVSLPELDALSPGAQVQLPTMLGAERTFTVGEVGSASYLGALGELPFRLVPDGNYRFVDLADGEGNFATIDYGEPGDAPALYVGKQVTLADLQITGGEVRPASDAKITATRLACPSCNAPIDLRAKDQAQRAVCAYCNTLLDVQAGALRVLEKLATKAQPRIPLGATCKLTEGELTVIGYVARSAEIDGTWYPFEEYLLYAPAVGFRWLVQSDGHWSYVQPIATGAVDYAGSEARYDGVTFRSFQRAATLRVDQVLGEFYWQVTVGELVEANDFVAPPAMLSLERSDSEDVWSLSTYMKTEAVEAAFDQRTTLGLGTPVGVAPNQPDPTGGVATPLTLAFVALLALGIVFAVIAPATQKHIQTVTIPATVTTPAPTDTDPDPAPSNVFFSEPFQLERGKNVELSFRSALANNWSYVVASLVNVGSGDVITVDAAMEHYSGVEGGESWSEGKDHATQVVSPVAAGGYVLRLETQQGSTAADVAMTVRVRQGVFRGRYLGFALGVLGLPFLILGVYTYSFERRRWSNSTDGAGGAPKTALTTLIKVIALALGGFLLILKVFARSSDD